MISQKIENDIVEEFNTLREEVNNKYLAGDYDITSTKQFLRTYIPEEVIYKSEVLLDTLLNYLMEDAREKIKTADVKLQNAFYEANFRKQVREWTEQVKNRTFQELNIVKYTFDPRWKQGLIVSGTTFGIGTGITSAAVNVAGTVSIGITGGFVTIIASAIAYKLAFDKATPKAKELIKRNIEHYLNESQKQVSKWLEKVEEYFENKFKEFCLNYGFELERR